MSAFATAPAAGPTDDALVSVVRTPLLSSSSSGSCLTTPKGTMATRTTPGPTPGSSTSDEALAASGSVRRQPLAKPVRAVLSSDDDEDTPAISEPPHITRIRALVTKLLRSKGARTQKQVTMKEDEIKLVLQHVRDVLMSEPMHLRIEPDVRICGDIHGQYYDLLRIFERCGEPPNKRYLFLGDYVDRGRHSPETMVLLFGLKVLYPKDIHLLRGNHECASINKMYGFYDDVKRRYNVRLFKAFVGVFDCMPVAASVGEKILCMHGGLSPELDDLAKIDQIERPLDVPEQGLLCDLLWADPDEGVEGFLESDRGVSYLFGEDVVTDFLDLHGYDLVVRAHQVVEKGYSFFSERQLVTLFSAPSYCGEFDNAAAVMTIDPQMRCSFTVLH
eukprot:CAMPEP_0174877932 /NCGR_PEP_ID=MMETSP1114-20130205/82503_1 /TAXON_ID=312471 /ORGANISM="Neobodo designis, Strain CCAP 1951/1" /LENGTH=388 /DNA_ID=CAMNT_0016113319 /DNA_START=506 /DNA_END=1672 /DNA_ORIENTATION=+